MSRPPFDPFSRTGYWAEDADPYRDPITGVLSNIPGITNPQDLAAFDRTVWAGRAIEALAYLQTAPISLETWQECHRICFQDIFAWAGELRTVQLAKGESMFAHPEYVEKEARKIFTKMQQFQWKKDPQPPLEELAFQMAIFFGDLNAIHPFREGNGRTQRLLFIMWLAQHGYMMDWEPVHRAENLNAIIASFEGDYKPLAEIFSRIITPFQSE